MSDSPKGDFPSVGELVDSVQQLVSLPEVYYRLEAVIDDPDSCVDDLAAIIASDPDLTLRLLALVNSSLFAFPAQIDTVSRAVALIGTRQLRDLALATLVVRRFSGLPLGSIDMEAFWRHSLGVAVVARSIASWRREHNVERFYVLGLLHDVGRLVLLLKQPQAMAELLQRATEQRLSLFPLERATFGYDHAEVGGCLLGAWGLPASLVAAVASHHAPQAGATFGLDGCVAHLADLMVNAMAWGGSGQPLVPALDEAAWDALEMDADAIDEILSRARQQYLDSVAAFLS